MFFTVFFHVNIYLLPIYIFMSILLIERNMPAQQIGILTERPVMASKLKAVDPKSAAPSKPKVLVFGKSGIGKTWTSLDFPNVYYIDTESGADLSHYTDKLKKSGGAYLGVDQGSLSFDTVLEQVQALATEKHPYKTLVIDSISKLFNTEIATEMEKLGDKDVYGASKKPAVAYMRRLVSWLTRLDMNVIIIAHEKELYGMDEKKQRNVVGVTFDAWATLEYELHLCLNIFKIGGQRKARVTKTRLEGFGDAEVFEWSYNAFADKYGRDTLEGDVKQIVLATAEQLKELKDLFERVKLPDDYEEKCLKKAQLDGWDEMDTEKVSAVIKDIKNKYLDKKD